MRVSKKNLILFLLILLPLAGCVDNVYFLTEAGPDYRQMVSKKIFILLPKNPTIEEQKVGRYIESVIQKIGVEPVHDLSSSDYRLVLSVYDDSSTIISMLPMTSPTTSDSSTTNTPTYMPVVSTYISIQIYNSQKRLQGNENIVWSGRASALNQKYYENPQAIVDKLISLIGQDFRGHIFIK